MTAPGRRLKFAILVLVSQLLLISLSLAWAIHMTLVAANGAVYFVEANPVVLYGEVAATVLITFFAIAVFVLQLRRLGETRRNDDRKGGRRG